MVQIKKKQKIQGDWNKINKAEFWKDYKYLKENMRMEKYWEDKDIKRKVNETWTRMKCEVWEKKGNEAIRMWNAECVIERMKL